MSAANSALFSTSRTLFVLARNDQAPSGFGKLSRHQVPVNGLVTSSVIFLTAVILNFYYPTSAFTLITGVATMSFIFVWILLLVAHLKYKKSVKGKDNGKFKMPLFPIANYLTIAFFVAVLLVLAFDSETQASVIATIIFFIAMIGGYSLLAWNKKNN
jgi:AAT family amino acid transporter